MGPHTECNGVTHNVMGSHAECNGVTHSVTYGTDSRNATLRYTQLIEEDHLPRAVIQWDVGQEDPHFYQLVQSGQAGRPHEKQDVRVLHPHHLTCSDEDQDLRVLHSHHL